MTGLIAGAGTAEHTWRPWLAAQDWPLLDVTALGRTGRLVAVAAHPDDEILGVGGLLALLGGYRPTMIWATDGEASHPGAGLDPRRLARRRRAESAAALAALDVAPRATTWFGFPDGGLAGREAALGARLLAEVDRGSVVLAPWRGDGHPDHDACGRAAATVAVQQGAMLLEYPIWTWHWARPDDGRVPWLRARRVRLPDEITAAKRRAIGCCTSQTRSLGPRPEQAAVLPPEVVSRFLRGEEVLFA